ncbi:Exocyst complex component SEC5B [Sesamum alatum]|uniref:Exocyst complex component SEC5B n=1 Tax=Sesamum alatum TaxID=300844 RepID=A0AAE1Z2J6_9LAMI|nr:Exocyst complex component SEC5B [Sesamum alatum]
MVLAHFPVILLSFLLQASQVAADSSANNSVNKAEERLGDYLDEVAGMVCNTLSAYKSKVLPAFNDLEESNILNPHMNDAIKEISKVSRAFEAKESATLQSQSSDYLSLRSQKSTYSGFVHVNLKTAFFPCPSSPTCFSPYYFQLGFSVRHHEGKSLEEKSVECLST